MSYPADVTQVVVNGLFSAAQLAGAVPTGKVEFWPTTVLVDAGTKQLVEPGVVTATLDGAGAFSVTLMATDDPDLTPTGWGYWVRETVDGYPVRVYIIQLPAAGTPFKLGNLQHLAVVALSPYLLASQLGQANGVASLDGAGQVPATQLANAGSGGGGGVPLTRSINTTAPLTGGGNLTADRTLAVSDATAGAKGVVQLAGDLSGTAAAPTVPGLAGKSATGHGHVEGDVTSLVTDLAAKVDKATLTTKGDLFVATGASTPARLGVGSNTQVLTADSTQASGIKWATPAAGSSGMDQIFPLAGYGLLACSVNPESDMGTSTFGNNTIFATRLWIPAGVAITNLHVGVRDAGTWDGATAGNKLALFTDAGVLVDATAETPSIWTSNGWRGGALAGGVVASQGAGRFVYILPLHRGMTVAPNVPFLSSANDAHAPWFDLGVGVTKRRCTILSGQTAIPGSFDPTASGTATTFVPVVGVS